MHEGFGWKCLGQVRLEHPPAALLGGTANTGQGPAAGETQHGAGHEAAVGAPVRASSTEQPQCFPPFLPALDAALHIGFITTREMKFFLLNLAQADLQCRGSFPTAGFPDLPDGPLGGWKCSALTSTLMHRRCDYPNAARLLSRHYALLLTSFSI